MKLQNSYIFLKHPYKKETSTTKDKDGNLTIVLETNICGYITNAFPFVSKEDNVESFYKRKYSGGVQIGKSSCEVEFIVTEVADVKYLDVIVDAKSKAQIVSCLEYIQETLLNSGIRERYIEIISYDSVSEYYCNKVSIKLNRLERNLRKLLFNIYILNFGKDYYQATTDIELQGKIKGLINSNISKEQRDAIKKAYNVNGEQAKAINCLQQFFYSFELGDIQNFLFKPSWTDVDEDEKKEFLSAHEDLSLLSDRELRSAILQFSPKSDWERFFSNKIEIDQIENIIDTIRRYRNSVAHYKFFSKEDYKICNKLINRLNKAILSAICVTEEVDFAKKNTAALRNALTAFSEKISSIVNPIREAAQKLFQSGVFQQIADISQKLQNGVVITQIGELALKTVLPSLQTKELAQVMQTNLALPAIANVSKQMNLSITQSLDQRHVEEDMADSEEQNDNE